MAKKKSVSDSYVTNMEHWLKLERNRLVMINNKLKHNIRELDLLTEQIELRRKYVVLAKATIKSGVADLKAYKKKHKIKSV